MALATANWSPLGENVFYRKFELYTMSWDIPKFDSCKVRVAPYGGPIVVLSQPILQPGQAVAKPTLMLFTGAGQPCGSIRWNSGPILELGWSLSEELLAVQEDGKVLLHDMFGNYLKYISLGQEVLETQAVDCRIFSSFYGTGVAVLTSTGRVFIISNIDDPRVRRLAEVPGLSRAPSSWCMVSEDRQASALVAAGADIYQLQQGEACKRVTPSLDCDPSSFSVMCVSFNHRQLALFTENGTVCLCSSSLDNVICEFNTNSKKKPDQIAWCGSGAVLLHWPRLVLVVGADKYFIKYNYDSAVHLQPEIDGVRIISAFSEDFFQKVPGPCQDVFKIGSMRPGALLLEAWREFSSRSQRAQEYLQHLGAELSAGVQMCIEAAAHEFDIEMQKTLLKAAAFGRTFLQNDNSDLFVNTCKQLRVLNAVREFLVGVPLTFNQLEAMSVTVLVDRLVSRQLYPLAMKICSYLKVPEAEGASKIVKHWALLKVKDARADEVVLAQQILDKVHHCSGLSIAEIADKAINQGRPQLAIELLEKEPRAAEQVPLLLKLDRGGLALRKAIDSGDTDLIYRVILHLKKCLSLGDFYRAIREETQAQALYLQYCRSSGKTKVLQDLFYQEDNHTEEAICRMHSAYGEQELKTRVQGLTEVQTCFNKARNEFAARTVDEQNRLLRVQQQLEEKLGGESFLDLSLHATVRQLLGSGHLKLAEQLRKDFKIADRRWWWLKIRTLGSKGEWMELEKFCKSKKSPIGYEPFVEVCAENGNKVEAQKYITKVAPENRVRCLVKADDISGAAEYAQSRGDPAELNYVLSKVSSAPQHKHLVEPLVAALRAS